MRVQYCSLVTVLTLALGASALPIGVEMGKFIMEKVSNNQFLKNEGYIQKRKMNSCANLFPITITIVPEGD